jgi:hypothetical protein
MGYGTVDYHKQVMAKGTRDNKETKCVDFNEKTFSIVAILN